MRRLSPASTPSPAGGFASVDPGSALPRAFTHDDAAKNKMERLDLAPLLQERQYRVVTSRAHVAGERVWGSEHSRFSRTRATKNTADGGRRGHLRSPCSHRGAKDLEVNMDESVDASRTTGISRRSAIKRI